MVRGRTADLIIERAGLLAHRPTEGGRRAPDGVAASPHGIGALASRGGIATPFSFQHRTGLEISLQVSARPSLA